MLRSMTAFSSHMSLTNYQRGADKERRVVNKARAEGHLAFRSAGSHSPIDVFILDKIMHQITLVQCKPKSMSENAKLKILEELKQFEGTYFVNVEVK